MLQEHSLWQFSLDVYSHSELKSLLLEAQDTAGADVNFILAALWLAQNGMAFAQERATSLWQTTLELREQGIAPVRALRRNWKHIEVLQDTRQILLELELELEKRVQDVLYQAFASDDLTGESTQQTVPSDLQTLIARNLAALPVSDQAVWDALAPRIAAQYSAIAGQI